MEGFILIQLFEGQVAREYEMFVLTTIVFSNVFSNVFSMRSDEVYL